MNIDTIEVYYDRKVQLDQFEPITFGATATVSLEDGDDPDEVYAEVAGDLQDSVERELARRVATKKREERE
ncbi:hypothetical protein HTZ84_09760 [Haloterrigena sp. SYSU A558-1]|uniref:Uncharacterized protein n=1 Tax=Haloterrigena gelatinilytica TaxID=2741724 RepID=A0ABX2LFH0_9EURY|nr:hypothetical protein [Haloterrigena gelatinilytica]NUC72591.1 hypothetical protein [Haloterrigena gelatinilytica]